MGFPDIHSYQDPSLTPPDPEYDDTEYDDEPLESEEDDE